MKKVSELLGKAVISIYDGNLEGYVKNVLMDKKLNKIVWLEIFDDENQEEKIVDATSIYYIENDAIMIKNQEHVYLSKTMMLEDVNPIGFKVFLTNGKFKEKISDVEFDEKLNIKNIYFSNNEILNKKNILSVGKNLIVEKNKQTEKKQNFKPHNVEIVNQPQTIVEIMNTENTKQTIMPKKLLTTGYEFLIGRKVGQNIYADNGGLIAKKQSKITSQIIDNASQNGKLKELTTYSLN